jgi:hypothetical protein
MRLYHFLSQKYAFEALKNKRIKVSIIDELNDPFEFLPRFSNPNREDEEKIFKTWKSKISKEHGIICFSKRWSNPLLWSHYAEKHKGFALGFDIPNDVLIEVKYKEDRPLFKWDDLSQDDGRSESPMAELTKTKFSSWNYEEEFRFGCTFSNCILEEGIYYENFSSKLILKEVITGCNNTLNDEKLLSLLGEFEKITVIRSKKHLRHYQIVKEKEVRK